MRRNLKLVALLVLVAWGCKPNPPKAEGVTVPGAAKVQPAAGPLAADAQPESSDTQPGVQLGKADVVASRSGDAGILAGDMVEIPSLSSLTWSMTPDQLDVMRPTEVEFQARWEGVDEGSYRCQWDAGDRSGKQVGCRLKHTYNTGLADRKVTLVVYLGGQQVFTEARPLPMERLSVTDLPGDDSPVSPPEDDGKSVRVFLWSAFAAPTQKDVELLRKALVASGAKHAVLFFNMLVDGSATRGLVDSLQQETGVSFLPVFCGGLTGDGAGSCPIRLFPMGRTTRPRSGTRPWPMVSPMWYWTGGRLATTWLRKNGYWSDCRRCALRPIGSF